MDFRHTTFFISRIFDPTCGRGPTRLMDNSDLILLADSFKFQHVITTKNSFLFGFRSQTVLANTLSKTGIQSHVECRS